METDCKTNDLGAASGRKKSSAHKFPAIDDCISGTFSKEGANEHGAIWSNDKA